MRVGGSHKWYYDKGIWSEKKITPDKWELFILSTKRGLGMPQKDQEFQSERSIIDILAHQNVRKFRCKQLFNFNDGINIQISA